MHLNTLSPAHGSKRLEKRLGRGVGSGLGKTGGRGHKGQKSRSGGNIRRGFEGGQMPLSRRVPKFGFNTYKSIVTTEVRLFELARIKENIINLNTLKSANIIKVSTKFVKIMLSGEIKRAITVIGLRVSRGARTAIELAGGKIKE